MQTGDILFAILWVAFYGYWLISAAKNRTPVKKQQSRLSFLTYGGVWIAICLIPLAILVPGLVTLQVFPGTGISFAIGLVLTVAGLAFAVWARIHLGNNWSSLPAIREGHTVIRTGPYRYVRHPIYSGILLAMAGTALGTGYAWLFCCVVILLVMFILKFRVEERFLEEEFGDEYARYKREVSALIPYVI